MGGSQERADLRETWVQLRHPPCGIIGHIGVCVSTQRERRLGEWTGHCEKEIVFGSSIPSLSLPPPPSPELVEGCLHLRVKTPLVKKDERAVSHLLSVAFGGSIPWGWSQAGIRELKRWDSKVLRMILRMKIRAVRLLWTHMKVHFGH